MSMPSDYISRDEFHTTLNLRILELRRELQIFMSGQMKKFESFVIGQHKEFSRLVIEQQKEFSMLVIEQRKEFERYTGTLKEHFEGGIEAIVEGVNMNMEKTERLEQFSKKEIDGLDRRLSQFEMTRARKRVKKLEDKNRKKNR